MYKAVPSTMQMQAADCGAASLKMILDFNKTCYTLEEVRTLIGVGNDGSTIGDIRQAAQKVGLVLEANELKLEDLHSVNLPCILWWDHVHFVVYEGTKSGKEVINDPAIGRRHLIQEEFLAAWTGVAIIPTDTTGLQKGKSESLVSNKQILAFLISGASLPVMLGLAFNTLGIIPAIVLSQLTSYFTDQVLILNQLSVAKSLLWSFFGLTGASALLSASAYYLTNRADYVTGIKRSIAFFDFILELPMSWHASRNPQELATRLVLPSKMISTLTYSLISSIATVLKTIIILVFVFAINIQLALLFTAVFIMIALVTLYINYVTTDNNQALSVENGKQQSTALGTLMNIENIRSVGEENLQFSTWSGYYTNYINFQQKISVSQSYASLASFSGTYLFTAVLVIASPLLIIKGEISIGDFIGLQFLVGYLSSGASIIPTLLTQYQTVTSPATRLRDAFEGTPNFDKTRNKMVLPSVNDVNSRKQDDPENFNLKFENVNFEYRPGKKILDNLSFSLQSHHIIRISGDPGSGLTTALKLISGLLVPTSGKIVTETDNKENLIEVGDFRYISGDPVILDRSFSDNITLMDKSYEVADIVKSAKYAKLFEYLKLYTRGIFTTIPAHGNGLSNVMKSRLLIARVLINSNTYTVIDTFLDLLPKEEALEFLINLKKRNIGSILVSNKPEYEDLFDESVTLNKNL